ncbi:ADP-ribosylation factor-like protein 16 isoform X3 [Pelodiscus sinensis]|uniref:ADP-ribosylation factor-like protein 16 isoform X3 n=1 Tax=Pelodiscus sinensis TaxID=13735 RepID=UPI003F6AC1E2
MGPETLGSRPPRCPRKVFPGPAGPARPRLVMHCTKGCWVPAQELHESENISIKVGTNLTDLSIQKKITIRELGGCMGPIWSSFYGDCSSVLFMIDAANPTQIAASCVQLLSVLSAEQLASAAVLILFNKIDLPCYMSLVEMKSLFRIPEIISCAKQPITVVETSAREGTGLPDVLRWLRSTLQDPS